MKLKAEKYHGNVRNRKPKKRNRLQFEINKKLRKHKTDWWKVNTGGYQL